MLGPSYSPILFVALGDESRVDGADHSTEARVQKCQTKSHNIVVNSFNFVYTFIIQKGFAFARLYTLFIVVYTFFYTWQQG